MRIAPCPGLRQPARAMTDPRRPVPPPSDDTPSTPAAKPPARTGRPRKTPAEEPAGGSAVVDRALAILDALAARDGLPLSDIARQLGLAPSTTHRLLGALAARRLVEADPATQGWSIGPGAVRLGAAFLRRGGLAERARPALDRLAAESGETAALAVPDADAALVVAEAAGPATLRVVLAPGTRLPLHASAAGKALIAHLPLARVEALLGAGPLPALTPQSLTDQGALTADLATLRHAGWLSERDESVPGQSAVAAPVFAGLGDPVAALTLAGPSLRLDARRIEALGPTIAAAAAALGAALGGR